MRGRVRRGPGSERTWNATHLLERLNLAREDVLDLELLPLDLADHARDDAEREERRLGPAVVEHRVSARVPDRVRSLGRAPAHGSDAQLAAVEGLDRIVEVDPADEVAEDVGERDDGRQALVDAPDATTGVRLLRGVVEVEQLAVRPVSGLALGLFRGGLARCGALLGLRDWLRVHACDASVSLLRVRATVQRLHRLRKDVLVVFGRVVCAILRRALLSQALGRRFFIVVVRHFGLAIRLGRAE